MNPYLEHPAIWPAVHTNLIVSLQDALVPLLRPRYYVTVQLRVYEVDRADLAVDLVGAGDVMVSRGRTSGGNGRTAASEPATRGGERPGVLLVELPAPVEIQERYLEIRVPQTHDLITTIEVLSPTNKRPGRGRQQYEAKRRQIAETLTNLVEIDLVRAEEPLPVLRDGALLSRDLAGDYRVLVSRGAQRHRAELYTVSIRDPLPTLPVPLRPGEAEPEIDLQATVEAVYERGGYDLLVDYRDTPVPPLAPADAEWADHLLRSQSLR